MSDGSKQTVVVTVGMDVGIGGGAISSGLS